MFIAMAVLVLAAPVAAAPEDFEAVPYEGDIPPMGDGPALDGYGGSPPPPPVPEPTVLVMLGIGACALLKRRRCGH